MRKYEAWVGTKGDTFVCSVNQVKRMKRMSEPQQWINLRPRGPFKATQRLLESFMTYLKTDRIDA